LFLTKYFKKLDKTSSLVEKSSAEELRGNLYGRVRKVLAYDLVIMLKASNARSGLFGFIARLSGLHYFQQI